MDNVHPLVSVPNIDEKLVDDLIHAILKVCRIVIWRRVAFRRLRRHDEKTAYHHEQKTRTTWR
jgi:hypothetical protein